MAPPPPPYGSQSAHGKLDSIGALIRGCSVSFFRASSRFGRFIPGLVIGAGGVVEKLPPGPVPPLPYPGRGMFGACSAAPWILATAAEALATPALATLPCNEAFWRAPSVMAF